MLDSPNWNESKEAYDVYERDDYGHFKQTWTFDTLDEANRFMNGEDVPTRDQKESESPFSSARSNIQKILEDSEHLDNVEEGEDLPAESTVDGLDQGDMMNKSYKKAQRLMKSIVDLYLSANIIKKSEYAQVKVSIDRMNVETLIYQLIVNKHAINKMLSQIDAGNMHPRMFEVFTQLQKTNLEIMKSQVLHLMNLEDNYKRLGEELGNLIEVETEPDNPQKPRTDETENVQAGQKDFMKRLTEDLENMEMDEGPTGGDSSEDAETSTETGPTA